MSARARVLAAIFVVNLIGIVVLWWSRLDGGELSTAAGALNAAGRITALVGTYLLFVQLMLRTHIPWLVDAVGKDPLKRLHTWNAYLAIALIGAHVVLQIAGYALQERVDVFTETALMLRRLDGVALAEGSLLALAVLTLLSLDHIRHRFAWPTWRALHLYTYAAVALAVPHIFATGDDFFDAPLKVAYWTLLELAVFAVIIAARVPPVWRAATANGRPHPAVVAVGTLIVATYLFGTVRLSSAQTLVAPQPTPRATSPSGPSTRPASTVAPAATLMVQGDVIDTPYGPMQVRVVLGERRIVDVEPVLLPRATQRSRTISLSVEPWLRKRAIAAQSADFEILSGATYTSRAYQESLESALRAAGLS